MFKRWDEFLHIFSRQLFPIVSFLGFYDFNHLRLKDSYCRQRDLVVGFFRTGWCYPCNLKDYCNFPHHPLSIETCPWSAVAISSRTFLKSWISQNWTVLLKVPRRACHHRIQIGWFFFLSQHFCSVLMYIFCKGKNYHVTILWSIWIRTHWFIHTRNDFQKSAKHVSIFFTLPTE